MFHSEIELRDISEIAPYDRNAKAHPTEQVKKIARSIEKFGFDQPIVIDKKGEIIKGHGRLMAAQYLGLKQVPVVVNPLSKNDAKACRIADNKVAESAWIEEMLTQELEELAAVNYKLEETGFDTEEIDVILNGLNIDGDNSVEVAEQESFGGSKQAHSIICPHCGESFVPGNEY